MSTRTVFRDDDSMHGKMVLFCFSIAFGFFFTMNIEDFCN